MRRADSLKKPLCMGKVEGRRRRWRQRMRWLDGSINSIDMSLNKLWGIVKDSLACCSPWSGKEWDMTEQLKNNKGRASLIFVLKGISQAIHEQRRSSGVNRRRGHPPVICSANLPETCPGIHLGWKMHIYIKELPESDQISA